MKKNCQDKKSCFFHPPKLIHLIVDKEIYILILKVFHGCFFLADLYKTYLFKYFDLYQLLETYTLVGNQRLFCF